MSASQASRGRRLLDEIVRFLAVGGVATAVSFIGFNVLVHGSLIGFAPMADDPLPAYVLVNLAGGWIAFMGIRHWAFNHRDAGDAIGAAVRFFVLGVLTMLIPVACLAFSRYVLGLSDVWADNISANVVGLGLGTAARFWTFRRYVFVEPAPVAAETQAWGRAGL